MERPSYNDFCDGVYNYLSFAGFNENTHKFDYIDYDVIFQFKASGGMKKEEIGSYETLLEAANYAYDRVLQIYDNLMSCAYTSDQLRMIHDSWDSRCVVPPDRENYGYDKQYIVIYEWDNYRMIIRAMINRGDDC